MLDIDMLPPLCLFKIPLNFMEINLYRAGVVNLELKYMFQKVLPDRRERVHCQFPQIRFLKLDLLLNN